MDGGETGPLFRVIPGNNMNDCFEASSMSNAWKSVLQRITEMCEVQGEPTLDSSLSGSNMFGLADPYVVTLIEGLENADKCEGYVFRNNRRKRQKVKVKIADIIPQGDGVDDWSNGEDEHEHENSDNELVNTESNAMEVVKEEEKGSRREENSRPPRRSSRNLKKEDGTNSEKKRQICIPMMGPATGLRVRCRKVASGYIPVDSLMYVYFDDIFDDVDNRIGIL